MQQTGCGGTGRWAAMLAVAHLDGRRRLAACAVAGAAALLLGLSGVAAHGGGSPGGRDHGRIAAPEHVTTSVQAVGHTRDDRGNGDDRVPSTDEHGNGHHQLTIAVAAPPPAPAPTPTPHGLRLGNSDGSAPMPAPVPPVTGPPPGGTPTTTRPTTTRSVGTTSTAPATTVPPPSAVPPSTPPQQPAPSLPPLVLIPPLGLPTPPALSTVAQGSGVVPLVVVLVSMAALSVILGLRLARRSR